MDMRKIAEAEISSAGKTKLRITLAKKFSEGKMNDKEVRTPCCPGLLSFPYSGHKIQVTGETDVQQMIGVIEYGTVFNK